MCLLPVLCVLDHVLLPMLLVLMSNAAACPAAAAALPAAAGAAFHCVHEGPRVEP
jgi:hypothetical protein